MRGVPRCTRPTPRWSLRPGHPGLAADAAAGGAECTGARSGPSPRTALGSRSTPMGASGSPSTSCDLRRSPQRPGWPAGRPRRRPAGGAVPGRVLRARPRPPRPGQRARLPGAGPALPVPGVHLTRRVDGGVLVGPNAVLALAREGYRWRDLRLGDLSETLAWPGFRRMAARHWRTGVREVGGRSAGGRSATPPAATCPSCARGPAGARSGVRAQAVARDGTLVDDFNLSRRGRVVAIRNAPSPAATSSMAIAEPSRPGCSRATAAPPPAERASVSLCLLYPR